MQLSMVYYCDVVLDTDGDIPIFKGINMKYELFSQLYSEAQKYINCDMFVGERDWQEWMSEYDDKGADVGKILISIWDISSKDIKELRTITKLSRAAFSRRYDIPVRTLEDWDAGRREPLSYLTRLIAFTVWCD